MGTKPSVLKGTKAPVQHDSKTIANLAWMRNVWESAFGILSERLRRQFLDDPRALHLAQLERPIVRLGIKRFGPKLQDVLDAIRGGRVSPEPNDPPPEGSTNDLEDLRSKLRKSQKTDGEFSAVDFLVLWVDIWGLSPNWSSDEISKVVRICASHSAGHIKSSIRTFAKVDKIAARCADLAAGRNPNYSGGFADGAYERRYVHPPPKPSGLPPTQMYSDDT